MRSSALVALAFVCCTSGCARKEDCKEFFGKATPLMEGMPKLEGADWLEWAEQSANDYAQLERIAQRAAQQDGDASEELLAYASAAGDLATEYREIARWVGAKRPSESAPGVPSLGRAAKAEQRAAQDLLRECRAW